MSARYNASKGERSHGATRTVSHSLGNDSLQCVFLIALLYVIYFCVGNPLFAELAR